MTFLNLQREEEDEVRKGGVISTANSSVTGSSGSELKRNALVGLKILDGDQHAFLMEPRGCVLLRNLLALLRFVLTRFL